MQSVVCALLLLALPPKAFAESWRRGTVTSETVSLAYAVPAEFVDLAGPPAKVISFPTSRPFPRPCQVVGVGGLESRSEPRIHKIAIQIVVYQLSLPRFDEKFEFDALRQILEAEKVSLPVPGKKSQLAKDRHGRTWTESVVRSDGAVVTARSFARPIGASELLVVQMQLSPLATEMERNQGLAMEDSVVDAIEIRPERF